MAKKPVTSFATALQTTEELKKQKDSALVDPNASTRAAVTDQFGNVTKDTQAKTQAVRDTYSKNNLGLGTVAPAAGGFSVQQTPTTAPLITTPQAPTTFEGALGFDMTGGNILDTSSTTGNIANIQGQGQTAKTTIDQNTRLADAYNTAGWTGIRDSYLQSHGVDLNTVTPEELSKISSEIGFPIDKSATGLNEKGREIAQLQTLKTDVDNNILGSNRNIGEVGKASPAEIKAFSEASAIAGGDPTSNVDILSSVLGMGYDPDLAKYSSQVYDKDLSNIRGETKKDVSKQEQAQAKKASSIEDYLTSTKEATDNLNAAKTEASKKTGDAATLSKAGIDTSVKTVVDALNADVEKAKLEAPGKAKEVFNQGVTKIVSDMSKGMGTDISNVSDFWSKLDTFEKDLQASGKMTDEVAAIIKAQKEKVSTGFNPVDPKFGNVGETQDPFSKEINVITYNEASTPQEVDNQKQKLIALKTKLSKNPSWNSYVIKIDNKLQELEGKKAEFIKKANDPVKQGQDIASAMGFGPDMVIK